MARDITDNAVAQQVRETTVQNGNVAQTTQEVINPAAERNHRTSVAARVIGLLTAVLLTLLGLRFLFALLGANAANGFANFIYSVTYPLVSPFFNLFGYNFTVGVSRVELYTLVAMLIYGLVAYLLTKLVTIGRR